MKPHSVDQTKAMAQWETLVKALERAGVKVEVIEQAEGVPDMVFATDQGIAQDGTMHLANFRYPERKRETKHYRKWFQEHGFEVRELTNLFHFEGGDTLFMGDMLLVGTGFRADVASCEELAEALKVDVVPLRLVDAHYYHLDMAFLPLDAETAFYYPPAFSDNSQALLQRIIPNLHEFTTEEVEGYAANSFVTGDTVVTQAGNESFVKQLRKLGKQVVEVDMSEFKKAGGGIHCLINSLETSR